MVWKISGLSGKFLDCLESFHLVWKVSIWPGKFLDNLESFWMVLKVSRLSGKFPDCVICGNDLKWRETWFWDNLFLFFLLFNLRWAQLYVSLVSIWSGKFPDNLESFWMVLKGSGSGQCLDNLVSLWMVLKVCGWSGKCPDVQVINFENCAFE